MPYKKVHPELIVNRFQELKKWIKSIDPIIPDFMENKYFYAKLGNEFGYKPETIRRILLYEIHGINYRKKKKGGRK